MEYPRFDAAAAKNDADIRACGTIIKELILSKGDVGLAAHRGRKSDLLRGYPENVFDLATQLHSKASIVGTSDPSTTSPTAAIMRRVMRESILGQLPGAIRVPFRSTGKALFIAGSAGFVAEGASIPVRRATFADLHHNPFFIAAVAAFTNETTRGVGDNDTVFFDEVATLLVIAANARFSGSAAASGSAPAGVANSAATVASTGATPAAITKDIADAIRIITVAGFTPDTVIASPAAKATFALLKISDPSGDTIAGLRLVSGVGTTGVTVLASNRIALSVDERVSLTASTQGDLQMSDTPSNDFSTPTASSKTVSLFQVDATAIRGVLACAWTVATPSTSVVSITSPAYA